MIQTKGAALEWAGGHEKVRIEPWGSDGLRVRGTLWGEFREDLPQGLLAAQAGQVRVIIDEMSGSITNGSLTAEVSRAGRLRFLRSSDGAELLAEVEPHFSAPPSRRYQAVGGGMHRFEVLFGPHDGERFYGLGQHQHGLLDQKGSVVELVQRNTEVSVPFLLSSRGYGFFWNHPGVGRVELALNGTRWVAEALSQWDYWVTAADEPAQIVRNFSDVTGKPPSMPYWATGFWQCKLRYRTQEELLGVAREYRRRELPLSVIVIDYFNWTRQGEWRFDPNEWPDPEAMAKELDGMGVKLMVSVWPSVNPAAETYREMEERGYLVSNEAGIPVHLDFWDKGEDGQVLVRYYDATNPEARRYVWGRVREGYYQYGVKTWWLDACEPEMRPEAPANLRYHAGPGAAVANIYPMLHAKGFYEAMRNEGEDEVVLLCRSAWAGSQRYGALVWSGDVPSSFDSLRRQVPAGLNIGLSGIPWWTTDIGGFHGGDIRDESFRELLVRWFQFGVFSPVCRLHGARQPGSMEGSGQTGAPNEVWAFGEPTYEVLRSLLYLREHLRPYIAEQMRIAEETGLPPMRPLFLSFPRDELCWEIADQFMLGEDVLVAPVVELGAREREVYLPAGADWQDAWTGEAHLGGARLRAPAPLEVIPVYLRQEGAIRPWGKSAPPYNNASSVPNNNS